MRTGKGSRRMDRKEIRDKLEKAYLEESLITEFENMEAEIAALEAENERLRVDKKAMAPSLERLKELNIATAFITLDRLKEICDYERAEARLKEEG